MEFSKLFKNQIIKDDIDLNLFDNKELGEWLVSNFVNILCDYKIFVLSVSLIPKVADGYKSLFSLNAKNEKSSHNMEFGILKNHEFISEVNTSSNRLSILVLENDFSDYDILNKLKVKNYNLSKIKSINTLIVY
tara:strand:+ start:2429 stop:2830 length:402 start_codon:yes stop_codon:yes gene_type:complete